MLTPIKHSALLQKVLQKCAQYLQRVLQKCPRDTCGKPTQTTQPNYLFSHCPPEQVGLQEKWGRVEWQSREVGRTGWGWMGNGQIGSEKRVRSLVADVADATPKS